MGRHHMKLPEHLYLSPPDTPTSTSSPSFLSLKSATFSSAALFSEKSSNALAVGDRIPGFKTSAAFLITLRANLSIPLTPAASDSQTSTPDSLRPTTVNMSSSTGSLLPPPSPSPLAQPPEFPPSSPAEDEAPLDPLAGVPDLITSIATTDDQKIEALRLLADSVAQQRQLAATAVIFHPLTLSLIVALLAIVHNRFYKGAYSDLAIVATTGTGVVMAVLLAIRWAVGNYIDEAERVGTWTWLDGGREDAVGKDDDVVVTKFGEEIIGAVVFRGVRDSSDAGAAGSTKKTRRQGTGGAAKSNSSVHGVIRGWTVKRRYRGKGVGEGLLEEAVKMCREKGWGGAIEFADDHANSKRILWNIFNGSFEKGEKRARVFLERVVEKEDGTAGGRKKKR